MLLRCSAWSRRSASRSSLVTSGADGVGAGAAATCVGVGAAVGAWRGKGGGHMRGQASAWGGTRRKRAERVTGWERW